MNLHQLYGDMRTLATGVHSAGTTTFTLDIDIAGLDRAVRISDGVDGEITRTGAKTYTTPGDMSGDCILFAQFDSHITTSRFHPRLQDGNLVRFENELIPQRFTAFVSPDTYCFMTMTRLKSSDGTTENTRSNNAVFGVPDAIEQGRSVAVLLDGVGRAVSVTIEANGHHFMNIHGWEYRGILMENAGL